MIQDKFKEIVKKHETPLYIYDGEKIWSQYKLLEDIISKRVEIFYAMKANPLLGICEIYKNLGSGIEVASLGELYVALESGFSKKNIIFTGPGKNYKELEYAICNNIYCINVESLSEILAINKIGEEQNKIVDIGIRLNPDFDVHYANIKMTGVSTQFGIDESQMENVFRTCENLSNIKIIGIHVYTGSHILSAQGIIHNIEQIIKLAIQLSKEYKFDLKFLDVGGGLGIPIYKNETDLDLDLLKKGFLEIWATFEEALKDTRLVLESGAFLIKEAGYYATKVLYKKECKGVNYLVIDGGIHQHEGVDYRGRNSFPMQVINNNDAISEEKEYDLVGALCTPRDLLGKRVTISTVNEGDFLVMGNSGGYGLTHSSVMFLSHLIPMEIIWYNGKIHILRERGNKEDYLSKQNSILK